MSRPKNSGKEQDLASSQKLSHKASPSTSLVSERLTNSEIESLRQDLKDKAAYLQKVFPNARLIHDTK